MVTPTYYVYFTSTTIITSAVLFRGFAGSASSLVTVIMGFLTICSGVVLLQLSKSAKDVPDAAVFTGDLDQIHTIAEQEQPETEPKADAIRGAAAILRRFSNARQKMEVEELRRLHEEKLREALEPVSEDGQPMYEWDGLRRRKTTLGSHRSRAMTSPSPNPYAPTHPYQSPVMAQTTPQIHPPLGMSHFPTEEELAEHDRPRTPGALSSIVGTIRSRARSVLLPGHPDYRGDPSTDHKAQSSMHPVQLSEISVQAQKTGDMPTGNPYGDYGLPRIGETSYGGAGDDGASMTSSQRHIQWGGDNRHVSQGSDGTSLGPPPTPPPHGGARRQFSFQNVFRRHQQPHSPMAHDDDMQESSSSRPHTQPNRPAILKIAPAIRGYSSPQVKGATEEERLGLVKGDSSTNSLPTMQQIDTYGEDDSIITDDSGGFYSDDKDLESRYGRGITYMGSSPPRLGSGEKGDDGTSSRMTGGPSSGEEYLQQLREQRRRDRGDHPPGQGGMGSFV